MGPIGTLTAKLNRVAAPAREIESSEDKAAEIKFIQATGGRT
jgi:hypothetical protein